MQFRQGKTSTRGVFVLPTVVSIDVGPPLMKGIHRKIAGRASIACELLRELLGEAFKGVEQTQVGQPADRMLHAA